MHFDRTLLFDLETHNAGTQYGMTPREFVRTMAYAWGNGPIRITTDYDEMLSLVRSAAFVVAHNGHGFDMSVLFGKDSIEPLRMALDKRVVDTMVLANLVNPAPYSFTTRAGHTYYDGAKPEKALKWLSLDNQCHVLGLPGKVHDLSELAKKYNPEGTKKADLDYGAISITDTEFLEYAIADVEALRGLYLKLIEMVKSQGYPGDYIWRENMIWALNAQISRNGILVDRSAAEDRVKELAERKEVILKDLQTRYGMPVEGKSPWATNAGKDAIYNALAEYGISPKADKNWPKTPTGAPQLSGANLAEFTKDTEAEELGAALAELKGQRSLAQLTLDSLHPDGRIHPEITLVQRSGRTSVSKPGLTVWTARGPGAVEKRYMIADPGTYMVELDYSAADARAVTAVSGDAEFAKRFAPGEDAHEITGRIFFGDLYDTDPKYYRNKTKPGTHGMSYRIGAKKLAATLGVTVPEALGFLEQYRKAYPYVAYWQDKVTKEGESGYVTNDWGRRLPVDPERSFNQSSALIGQSTSREILFQGLLDIAMDDIEKIRWVRMTVHDALVICVPCATVESDVEYVMGKMQRTFHPKGKLSMPVDFVMDHGPLDATNWFESGH